MLFLLCHLPGMVQLHAAEDNGSGVASIIKSMIEKQTTDFEKGLEIAKSDENVRRRLLANSDLSERMIDMMQEKAERYGLPNEVRRLKACRSTLSVLKAMTTQQASEEEKKSAVLFNEALDSLAKIPIANNPAAQAEEVLKKLRQATTPDKDGFFTGLWHGFLLPFRFIASFFMNIDIYADNNTGNGYLIGFILGVVSLLGGGGGSTRR